MDIDLDDIEDGDAGKAIKDNSHINDLNVWGNAKLYDTSMEYFSDTLISNRSIENWEFEFAWTLYSNWSWMDYIFLPSTEQSVSS